MKRIFVLVAILGLAGCAGNYKTTFDHDAAPEPITVHVVPVVTKEEMDVQIQVADSSAASAQFGLIGGLVGAIIDSAVNKRRAIEAERRAEVLREISGDYSIIDAAHQSTLRVGNHERWEILTIEEPTSTAGFDDLANDAFEAGDARAIAVLDFDYALTPAINQVRVNVTQRIYDREMEKKSGKNRKPRSTRIFTYFSPAQELANRPYRDGEKEELIGLLKSGYEERIAAHPDEREDLEKSMEAELKDLEESTTIPEPIAILETWTPELLKGYLDQSIDHVAFMIRHDWEAATVPEEAERTEDTITIVNANGLSMTDKGKDIGRLDANEVYRSQWGNIYSIPVIETADE
jgi:outer membrane lipoprotein SlyB